MKTLVKNFGSRCDLPDDFIRDVAKLGIEKHSVVLAN